MRTLNAIRQRIETLFASWHSWSGADIHDGPIPVDHAITAAELHAHATHIAHYLKIAESIRDDPQFATWAKAKENADHVADLLELIDEMTHAQAEFADVLHPDNILAMITPLEKQRITHQTIVNVDHIRHLNARLQMKKVGQTRLQLFVEKLAKAQ